MGSSQYIAGIAGNSKSGMITNVYNLGEVTGYSQNYGVIIGTGDSVISNSYYKTDAVIKNMATIRNMKVSKPLMRPSWQG